MSILDEMHNYSRLMAHYNKGQNIFRAQSVGATIVEVEALREELAAAIARVARLEEALAWYADEEHYVDAYSLATGFGRRSSAELDKGTRARAALEAQP